MPEDIDACVAALKGKPGIKNAFALCNWMKASGKTLPRADIVSDNESLAKLWKEFETSERLSLALASEARTSITSDGLIRMYAPIVRIDEEQRMVYGYGVTTSETESGRKPITLEAMKAALPGYMKFANVREMHQLSAVGKAKEATLDEKGIYLGVKVADDTAWKKVKEEIYQGFSVGGRILDEDDDFILAMKITEFSLVDRPDIPDSIFDLWRTAENPEQGANKVKDNVKRAFEALKTAVTKFKEVAGEKLERSMWNVQELARMLENLHFMRNAVKVDAELAGDKASEMPGLMDELVKFFSAVLTQMVGEEVSKLNPEEAQPEGEVSTPSAGEAVAEAASKADDLQRKGAKLSKSTVGTLRNVHRIISQLLGLASMTDEAMDAQIKEVADAEAKSQEDEANAEKEQKEEEGKKEETAEKTAAAISTLEKENKELKERIAAIEKRAMPPKTQGSGGQATRKEEDSSQGSEAVQRAVDEAAKVGDSKALAMGIHKGYKPSEKL